MADDSVRMPRSRQLAPCGCSEASAISGGLRGQSAEAPFARQIFGNGALQRLTIEIGPILVDEDELGVSALPQEIVRQTLLAARADEKIGIGNAFRRKMTAEELGGDVFRLQTSF